MFLLLLPFTLLLVYFYLTKNYDYWARRNVKHDRPVPLFGNLFSNIIGKKSITEITKEMYNKYPNEKVVGLYLGTTPELIIRDLDIVKRILTTDFPCFYSRGLGRSAKIEPLFLNLFHVNGDTWKLLRQRLTPAFTSAKLKKMFPLVVECAAKLQATSEDIVNKGGECDVRNLMARFTIEFIGACGFGLQMDTIRNENSLFLTLGTDIFNRNRSWNHAALEALYDVFPNFRTLMQIFLKDSLSDIITKIVVDVRNQRNNKPSGRHDFIDLLLELEEKGKITTESIETQDPDGKPNLVEMELDLKCMVAQVFVFFAAGFETSSSATSYMLHELAFHPEEQIKVQEEIDQVLSKYGNKLCYDSIADMTLLSMCFKEAMRKFPSLGTLHRECVKRYTIPELGITLDPGVKIIIPVEAIQYDEKYFDNPFQFKPERFADTFKLKHSCSYLPFGAGHRSCIGARLGEMQSLAGVAALLYKFSVEPSSSTKQKLEVNHTSNTVQSIKGGLPLKLKLRKKNIDITTHCISNEYMALAHVTVYHGPCLSFHTMEHKPQKLTGLRNRLMKLGYKVDLIPVDHVNYCMLEMCSHEIFRCNLKNLHFNTHYRRDPVCQRAVEAVIQSAEKFKQARIHLWCWTYLDYQMFRRGMYTPKDYWPNDVELPKPYVSCADCVECCKIVLKKKEETSQDLTK
ncbi:unnamed protein product [Arctia plantaginis]|uniref:unspecific monooxygenase n=1 Tax=Arctia plantaginis TaxID=874455 RepID=A0A8S1AEZ2_ARCPL|nr:unnamed protein product [Arctia plantaginis]